MSHKRVNTMPRKSSPKGIKARLDARIAAHGKMTGVGRAGTKGFNKPGSLNPRKH